MTDEKIRTRPRRLGLRRGAYLLPSLFTMGNMVLGFYAIILGLQEHFHERFRMAAAMVFLAGLLDSIDGRIARLTGTESDFGREYDSLADVITFGAAPALLAYLWGLKDFAEGTWLLSVFFLVCCATRLARFNVQTKVVDSRYFVGLPTPAAAGCICSILLFAPEYTDDVKVYMQVVMGVALLVIGVLMVSTFRYHSGKKIDLRKRWSYRAFVPIAAVLLVIIYQPWATALVITALYTLSGPVAALVTRLRHRDPGAPEEAPPPVEGVP
ncbi:MAG TPA: CDP-diacylglycerol--serine O-phosphatidyltransferase [Thermoanaerobaculia bacterium]|nr:CDP-diacylglycerol--serine O-phosphatidyltransferase [Thermoanaerobaculia bacterium]